MSDLIARLQKPFLPSASGAYDGGIRLPLEARQELMDAAAIRIEAAAALAAKDAEIERQRKQIIRMGDQFDKKNRQIIAAVTEAAALRARLAAAIDALEQAQDCIRDETPECGTWEEARDDTLAKIRAVILPPHAPAKEASDA